MIVHAGLIAALHATRWRGVLIRGHSGAGKSDLALRTLRHGFCLVADDRVLLMKSKSRVFGRAPASLQGLLEVRGHGVLSLDSRPLAEVSLVVECVEHAEIERTPLAESALVLGASIPMIRICPLESSAPAKLCRALEHLGRARQQDYDAAFPRTAQRGST